MWVRLMETDAVLDVELRGRKLPHRPVQLLDTEPSRGHGVQEVVPGDLADLVSGCWLVEKRVEDLQCTLADCERRLDILLRWVCGRFGWACWLWRDCCAFGLGLDLGVRSSPIRFLLSLSQL